MENIEKNQNLTSRHGINSRLDMAEENISKLKNIELSGMKQRKIRLKKK